MTSADAPPLRFGILGCAGIAEKFCVSVSESGGAAVVHAVGSRSLEKCQKWIAENCPGATAHGSYDAVLEDDQVQAVYLPLPTALRTDWALKAAAKGKHIVCEKPIGLTAFEAAKIVEACREAKVQFMDNTMFMHHDRLNAMRDVLDGKDQRFKAFGLPRFVTSSFTVDFPQEALDANIRSRHDTEPLGCVGDLGWYNVRFTLWAFGFDVPEAASCRNLEATAEGVPLATLATLRFSNGRTATFDCSFRHALRQHAEVVGEGASLSVDDFVVTQQRLEAKYKTTKSEIGGKALCFPKVIDVEETVTMQCAQDAQLVRRFASLARGDGPRDAFWPRISLLTQAILDACMASAKKDGAWVDVAPFVPPAASE